jgi:hypothetical protein
MKNVLLTIALVLSVISAQAQSVSYQLKEFYNFEILSPSNPFEEYINHREIPLEGGVGNVKITFNETKNAVFVEDSVVNRVYVYNITEKYQPSLDYTRYTVQGPKGMFAYVVTKQPDGNVNVYTFWGEGLLTKGWASVAVK